MEIQIWSDIMCPFCYVGKRHLETALSQFGNKDRIKVTWKSFQLDASLGSEAMDTATYFEEKKGVPASQATAMLQNVTQMAQNAGLNLNFEESLITNTLHAHRLLHLAKKQGLGNEMKERLFKAHFSEGAHVGDHQVLAKLAAEVGLDAADTAKMLESDEFSYDVNMDVQEARNVGVQGVPFFVFNNKYALSGAQPVESMLQTLEKSFEEWLKDQPAPKLEVSEGPSCTTDGTCD